MEPPQPWGVWGLPEVRDRGAQGPEAPREHIASSGALPPPAYPVPTERDTDGRTPGPLGPAGSTPLPKPFSLQLFLNLL